MAAPHAYLIPSTSSAVVHTLHTNKQRFRTGEPKTQTIKWEKSTESCLAAVNTFCTVSVFIHSYYQTCLFAPCSARLDKEPFLLGDISETVAPSPSGRKHSVFWSHWRWQTSLRLYQYCLGFRRLSVISWCLAVVVLGVWGLSLIMQLQKWSFRQPVGLWSSHFRYTVNGVATLSLKSEIHDLKENKEKTVKTLCCLTNFLIFLCFTKPFETYNFTDFKTRK